MALDPSAGYDPYNYNNGTPPRPELNWDGAVWVSEDTIVVTIPSSNGNGKEYFSSEVKEALENNICVRCGQKNCPFIKQSKDYQKLLEQCKNGDYAAAQRTYKTKFAQFYGSISGIMAQTIQTNRAAQAQAEAAQKDVLIKTSEAITSYGEVVSSQISKEYTAIAKALTENAKNFKGKNIRTLDQAMASLNKVLANQSMKLNAADKAAVVNAWKKVKAEDMANKYSNLARFFKAGDLALKAQNLTEKTIEGYNTGNWKPLMLEVEAMLLSSLATGVGISVFMGLLSLVPLAGLTLAAVTIMGIVGITFLASLIDAGTADEINNQLIRPAY